MLPWLPKKVRKKTLFFSELLIFSAVIHFVTGLALFVLYRGQYESFSFEVRSKGNNKDQLVLFLPHRHRSRSTTGQVQGRRQSAAGAKRSNSCHVRGNRSKQSDAHTKKGSMAQQKSSSDTHETKKIAQKPATMFLDKQVNSKKQASVKKLGKSKAQKALDEPVQIANAAPKISKEIEVEKPIADKKIVAAEKSTDLEKEAIAKQAEQMQSHESVAQQSEQSSDIPESFDIAVGTDAGGDTDRGDEQSLELSPEAARIYYVVQEEISEHWKPPAGLPKDLVCTIGVRLDRQGAIADVTVKQSSGVLIYDMSASNAVQDMQLPRFAWGKEFSIAFRL